MLHSEWLKNSFYVLLDGSWPSFAARSVLVIEYLWGWWVCYLANQNAAFRNIQKRSFSTNQNRASLFRFSIIHSTQNSNGKQLFKAVLGDFKKKIKYTGKWSTIPLCWSGVKFRKTIKLCGGIQCKKTIFEITFFTHFCIYWHTKVVLVPGSLEQKYHKSRNLHRFLMSKHRDR